MAVLLRVCVAAVVVAAAVADPVVVDRATLGARFDGIGGLSGGGATSRLLVDYKEPQRTQILDYLFKPNFGAALQVLKVEIGGDSQSTDGTESSHMHAEDDLDYNRGYEWWLMAEAKKRNPDIKIYGLPWAFPGWVGEGSGDPFKFPDKTSKYMVNWVKGAASAYNVTVDYLGIWNERSSDATYAETLRSALDTAGFGHTKLVAKDGSASICDDLTKDPAYAKAIDIIGLHYPSDYNNYSTCHALKKPFWASEESSSYDDLNGGACWARVITSHWALSGMTSSIMWNLVGSYFHGTNWYASSMLTAVQPWSGYYEVSSPVWATAQVTQFTKFGWNYLNVGSGSGQLPGGGFFVTLVDPASQDFTINVVKIDREHAPCTRPRLPDFNVTAETVQFRLAASMGQHKTLACWFSNFEDYADASPELMVRRPDITVASDGTFSLQVPVGAFFTVSTITSGPQKGAPPTPIPASAPQLPLPHTDSFESYVESQEARYWSDQIGAFEIHPEEGNAANSVLRQMVPALPIGWGDHGSRGPLTLLGMREWRDLNVTASFKLPASANTTLAGCVGTRSDQTGTNAISFCAYTTGNFTFSYSWPALGGFPKTTLVTGSAGKPIVPGQWYTLSLETVDAVASASLDGAVLVSKQAIRTIDSGFAVIGSNDWTAIAFDNVAITQAGAAWAPLPRGSFRAGQKVGVAPCTPNGLASDADSFELLPWFGLRHVASKLCAQAASAADGSPLALAACDPTNTLQQLVNDYTRIRNTVTSVTLNANGFGLSGTQDGGLTIAKTKAKGAWNQWSFFPNTGQLRNQYTAVLSFGPVPLCVAA